MSNRIRALTAAALLVLASGTAAAQQRDPVGFRGGMTQAPGTVEPGTVELEAGMSFEGTAGARTLRLGELAIKLPLGAGRDLALGFNSWGREDGTGATGIEPASLTLGFDLFAGDAARPLLPAVTFFAGATLPTGTGLFDQTGIHPDATLALGWALPADLEAAAHGAWSPGDQAFEASFWLARPIVGPVHAYAEYVRARHDPAVAHAGIAILLTDDLHLDLHAGRCLGAADHVFGLGFVRRW